MFNVHIYMFPLISMTFSFFILNFDTLPTHTPMWFCELILDPPKWAPSFILIDRVVLNLQHVVGLLAKAIKSDLGLGHKSWEMGPM